jgi:hypothetical protein
VSDPNTTFVLDSPGLAKLVAQIAALIRSDADLRKVQSQNALQAKYFDQPAGGVTGATVYSITQAQNNNELFYQLVLTFDAASGSGRYRIDGPPPTPTTGIAIPAGGVVLTITGADNIKNFKLTAEALQTLTFARYVFA